MTTGRINQVACRAARAPIHHTRWSTGASTTRSATDRATDRRETRAHRWKTIDARATRTEPRWLQHVRAQCKMWVGVARATALSREQPRAPPEPETTRYKERAAASRRTESPLRPAEHPLATRGAQHTGDEHDGEPNTHRTGKGNKTRATRRVPNDQRTK